MIVGIKKAVCTCGMDMRRTGGTFGGDSAPTDTYYCAACEKHVVIGTPKKEEQVEFTQRINH